MKIDAKELKDRLGVIMMKDLTGVYKTCKLIGISNSTFCDFSKYNRETSIKTLGKILRYVEEREKSLGIK